MNDTEFDIVRPEDLLTAQAELVNLQVDDQRLVRVDSSESAGVVITLPPQHFRESYTGGSQAVDLVAAKPSMFEFLLPDGVNEVPIGPDGLLGVCDGLGVAPTYPLWVPGRAYLQPKDGQWSLGVRPVTLDGRTELWRAKLTGPVRNGRVAARFEIMAVSNNERPAWAMLPTPGSLVTTYRNGVMQASRFDLSPIGASVRMAGPIGYGPDGTVSPERQAFLDSYEHDIDFGRDSRVQVTTHGYLSSGHRATLVELNRRIFVTGTDFGSGQQVSFARLEPLRIIYVDDPVLSVDELVAAYGGPALDMPFRTLSILTQQTPPLDHTAVGGENPFWVSTTSGAFHFAMQGVDWEGKVTDFALPLIFIPGARANPDDTVEVPFDFNTFMSVHALSGEGNVATVGSAPIALADSRDQPQASARLTVESFALSVRQAIPAPGVPAGSIPPVLPVLGRMGVVLEAANQFTGLRTVVPADWHPDYPTLGLDPVSNPLGAFLTLPTPVSIPFDARRVGGLAKPDMSLGAVTALKGAVPAGFELGGRPDAATLINQFAGAKILGLVKLTEVLDLGSVLPPTLHQRVTATEAELVYQWEAPLRENGTILKPAKGAPEGLAKLSLTARMTRRFADGATTSHVKGILTLVDLEVAEVVRLHFDELAFTADPGVPPQITTKGISLEFFKELSFLQDLRTALESAGLSKGASVDVTSARITAGFAAALPSLPLGMFTVSNLSIATRLTIPFEDQKPVAFSFAVAERFKPFTVAVSMFSGGGFFALELDSDGIRRVEASLEFGGSMSLDIVVASGGVYVMAGIYFLYADGIVNISGYLRAGGYLSVLGIVTISADFYMQLSYQPETGKISGRASLTIGIKVLFFSKSVTLSVERTFAGSAGDPTFTDCFELEDWGEYCDAFA